MNYAAILIKIFTKDNSKFQHVFPGFILVAVEPEALNTFLTKVHNDIQNWISRNRYLLALAFMFIIVGLMLLSYVKGGYNG